MGVIAFWMVAVLVAGSVSYVFCGTEVAQRIAAAIGFDGEPEWRKQ